MVCKQAIYHGLQTGSISRLVNKQYITVCGQTRLSYSLLQPNHARYIKNPVSLIVIQCRLVDDFLEEVITILPYCRLSHLWRSWSWFSLPLQIQIWHGIFDVFQRSRFDVNLHSSHFNIRLSSKINNKTEVHSFLKPLGSGSSF